MTEQQTVHVFYRFASAGNLKARPPYFSKELALASFVRALELADTKARATFVVDGPADHAVLETMRSAGEVVHGQFGSNRASYRATISMVRQRQVVEDITWFAEDDYLYEPDALIQLSAAGSAIPEATWFAMSGPTPPIMLEMRRAQGPVAIQPLQRADGIADVQGRPWRRIDSTTSTFGGRTARVVHDERLLRAVPYTGAAWDRTTCLAVQGVTPYPWRHVTSDLLVPSTPRDKRAARVAYRLASRVAINMRAARLPANRGVLVAPVTPLVGHMNLPYEERPSHWEALAGETRTWALAHVAPTTGLLL